MSTSYTVRDLIAELEQYDEDAEVRVLVFQPNWPLRVRVCNVASGEEIGDDTGPGEDSEDNREVSASSENPYAPRGAWAERC